MLVLLSTAAVLTCTMYMMGVQPSMVTHWKMVSEALQMLSKLV
jgi:hypothetical protein